MIYDLNDKADKKRFENDLKKYCDGIYQQKKHNKTRIFLTVIFIISITFLIIF